MNGLSGCRYVWAYGQAMSPWLIIHVAVSMSVLLDTSGLPCGTTLGNLHHNHSAVRRNISYRQICGCFESGLVCPCHLGHVIWITNLVGVILLPGFYEHLFECTSENRINSGFSVSDHTLGLVFDEPTQTCGIIPAEIYDGIS